MDKTGRGVAAEQCALRAAQHFDAVNRAKFGQADARAVAVNAVDKGRDGAFEAGIVPDRTDAADTGTATSSFRRGRRHEQRGGQLVELADV